MPIDLSADTIRKLIIWGFVMFVAIPFGSFYGLVYWDSGIAGAVVGSAIGSVLTILGLFVVTHTSSIFGVLAGERSARFSKREQLESDIQQARYHKINKNYDVALHKVNAILLADSEYPEALFLKAQIVWEAFGNKASAVSNLKKIHKIVDDETTTVYRWAKSLIDEISAQNKKVSSKN